MKNNTFKVNGNVVTFGHTTKTVDGEVTLTTSFDFSNVSHDRLVYDAGTARLNKWRAGSGITNMTTAEALEKFGAEGYTVDCSKIVERVKHTKTEEEAILAKKTRAYMAQGLKPLAAMKAALQDMENEAMEADEVTEYHAVPRGELYVCSNST